MTMNVITHVHTGTKCGLYLIQMDAAASSDWLPLVRRVITAVGAGVSPDNALLSVIAAFNHNARDNMSAVVRVPISVQR